MLEESRSYRRWFACSAHSGANPAAPTWHGIFGTAGCRCMDQSAPFASRIGLTETLPSPGDLPAHQHRTVHRHISSCFNVSNTGKCTLQAIVLNYGVAAALGWVLCGGSALFTSVQSEPWVWVALGMGLLFIYLFQLIARTTQTLGLTVTSIASKLSMVLPVALFLAFDPLDALTWKKAWPSRSPSPPLFWLRGKRKNGRCSKGQHVGWCRWSFLSAADALI